MKDGLRVGLVAFDMAGTTVRDEGVVPYAFRLAVEPLGLQLSDEDVSAVRGADKREAIARLVRGSLGECDDLEAIIGSTYQRFTAALRTAFSEGPLAEVPGASALFAWLRENQVKVALTTGYDRATRDLILRRLGWTDGRVDAVVSAEDVSRGRPSPYMLFRAMELTGISAVDRLAAVGDTVVDLEAGANAGARFVVGVLGGAHDLGKLGRVRHTHLLSDLTALREVLDGP